MERLAHLKARIADIGGLLDVVSTMRSLAAVRMQQATESLRGAREYAEVIGVALGEALDLAEPDEPPAWRTEDGRALLLFCSEHGFVGVLNEAMLDHAGDVLAAGGQLFVVGSRGGMAARERSIPVAWSLPMTTRRDGVPALARRIAAELYGRFAAGRFTRLEMAFAMARAGGWSVERRSLLPLDPANLPAATGRVPPLHGLPVGDLIDRLVEAYALAQIVHGALESLAGENAARFAAMSAARENIERRLDDLRGLERRVRQEEITTELLDVITGARAVLETT